MNDSSFTPHKIYIEKNSFDFPLTQRILHNTSPIPKEAIDNPRQLVEEFRMRRDPIEEGKKYVLLTRQKGDFVKPCPCTPHYIGCNYFIIHSELNCPLDCSYCVLQHYLSNPLITVHVNLEDLWKELDIFIKNKRGKAFRIGTGELGDSLALDHITESSKDFIAYFRGKKNAFFELKTKTTKIKNVLNQEPAANIVISWSLNSTKMAKEQERGAPPVEERIEAARQVAARGFPVGFHLDPLIQYPGWEKDYEQLIEALFEAIEPAGIAWISLGSLRFPQRFRSIIQERFPREKIFREEFIRGKDGKHRYFRPLRLRLYREVVGFIEKNGGEAIPLYFCMESEDVWRDVMKWLPRSKIEVEHSLLPRGSIKGMKDS